MKHYPLLTDTFSPEAVVLANGEYPSHPLPLAMLSNTPYVVCCDGAADEYIGRGFVPDAIIGDGDSISSENRQKYESLLRLDNNQETNDQTKAVTHCLSLQKREIVIVGATGKREDHALGNISLLMDYMEDANVQLVTDYGFFTPVSGDAQFECYPGQQLSIINFGATSVKGEGLLYPLRDFTNWWQGTLNEAIQSQVTIRAKGKYLVFRTHPKE